MVHCSKILLNIWLFFFLLFSIPFTIIAWLFYLRRGYNLKTCYVDTVWLTVTYGILMFILCVMGIIGSLCRIRKLQSVFNVIVNIVLVLTLLITVFYLLAFPRKIPPLRVYEKVHNRTESLTKAYPPLLRTVLLNNGKWSSAKKCFDETHLCDPNASRSPEASMNYSPLLNGCCSPPVRCGLRNSSENHWEAPAIGLPPNDEECEMWTKISDGKCYDCNMCKAGYLLKFHGDWKGIAFFHIFFMLFLLMISIFTGCGAFTEPVQGHR